MITWEEEENNLNGIKDHLSAPWRKGNIKLWNLEHDTFLPHAKNIFYTSQVFYPNHYERKEQCIQPAERQAPPPRPRPPMPPWVGRHVSTKGAWCTWAISRGPIFPAQRHDDNPNARARKPTWVSQSKNHGSTMRWDSSSWTYKKRCWGWPTRSAF